MFTSLALSSEQSQVNCTILFNHTWVTGEGGPRGTSSVHIFTEEIVTCLRAHQRNKGPLSHRPKTDSHESKEESFLVKVRNQSHWQPSPGSTGVHNKAVGKKETR
jgi:hypothetical protein